MISTVKSGSPTVHAILPERSYAERAASTASSAVIS